MTERKNNKISKRLLTGLSLLAASSFQTVSAEQANFIIDCRADCTSLIEKVSSLGGTITNKYQNIDAISVTMDSDFRTE